MVLSEQAAEFTIHREVDPPRKGDYCQGAIRNHQRTDSHPDRGTMKNVLGEADEMRAEYDFSGGVRGKYAERYGQRLGVHVVREGDGFISVCPELNLASQGNTAEEARANLEEALQLFFETADEPEVRRRLRR